MAKHPESRDAHGRYQHYEPPAPPHHQTTPAARTQTPGKAFVAMPKSADDEAAIARVSAGFTSLGKNITSVGLVVAGFGVGLKGVLDSCTAVFAVLGEQMEKVSERTGIAVENLSELKVAAELTGESFETLEVDIRNMQVAIVKAASGSKDAAAAFATLGISAQALTGLSADEQINALADAFGKVTNSAQQAELASAIFGKRTGTAMLPLLQQGSAGIKAMEQNLRQLGITMNAADAKAAAGLMGQFTLMSEVAKALAFTVGAALAPSIKDLLTYVTEAVSAAKKWIDQNRDVVKIVSMVATAVIGAGTAIAALGFVFQGVGAALAVVGAFAGVAATLFTALISPIGIAAATVVGLAGYFLYTSDVAGKAFRSIQGNATTFGAWITPIMANVGKTLGAGFKVLKSDAIDAFDGIRNAISATDWQTAGQILWTTLELEWARGIERLHSLWVPVRSWLGDIWAEAVNGIMPVWANAVLAIKTMWADGMLGLVVGLAQAALTIGNTWLNMTYLLQRSWYTYVATVLDKISDIRQAFENAAVDALRWTPGSGVGSEKADAVHAFIDSDHDTQVKANDAARDKGINDTFNTDKTRADSLYAALRAVADAQRAAHDAAIASAKQEHDRAATKTGNAVPHTQVDDDESAKLQGQTDDLRKGLDALLAKAKSESQPHGPFKFPDMREQLNLAMAGVDNTKSTLRSVGTFNSSAIFGLQGGGSAAERTAKATEDSAKSTKVIAEWTKNRKSLNWG